ncbi:hypothetical protein MC885_004615 [Smutsia gigantea]|nr:hypothetical protein MC885_004615 [Smutsia gigantea]
MDLNNDRKLSEAEILENQDLFLTSEATDYVPTTEEAVDSWKKKREEKEAPQLLFYYEASRKGGKDGAKRKGGLLTKAQKGEGKRTDRCRATVQKISNLPWEDMSSAQGADEVGPTEPLSCQLDTQNVIHSPYTPPRRARATPEKLSSTLTALSKQLPANLQDQDNFPEPSPASNPLPRTGAPGWWQVRG